MNETLKCPGKVFVVGEYACLIGQPALLVPCSPEFSLNYRYPVEPSASNTLEAFAEGSPAGLLLRANLETALCTQVEWKDPYDMPIGVGSSSAQFVLVYQMLEKIQERQNHGDRQKMLQTYWETVGASQGLKPSGVDTLLQSFGKPCEVRNEPFSIRELSTGPLQKSASTEFLLAYSGRKTKTHDHLKELCERGFPGSFSNGLGKLAALSSQAIQAWDAMELPALGRLMNEYQEVLTKMELSPVDFTETVEAFQKIPGVLGCKGAGAQGGDCVLILSEKARRSEIAKALSERGFSLTSAQV